MAFLEKTAPRACRAVFIIQYSHSAVQAASSRGRRFSHVWGTVRCSSFDSTGYI